MSLKEITYGPTDLSIEGKKIRAAFNVVGNVPEVNILSQIRDKRSTNNAYQHLIPTEQN